MVEGGGLENRYTVNAVSWVRIPPSPPFIIETTSQRLKIFKNFFQIWGSDLFNLVLDAEYFFIVFDQAAEIAGRTADNKITIAAIDRFR